MLNQGNRNHCTLKEVFSFKYAVYFPQFSCQSALSLQEPCFGAAPKATNVILSSQSGNIRFSYQVQNVTLAGLNKAQVTITNWHSNLLFGRGLQSQFKAELERQINDRVNIEALVCCRQHYVTAIQASLPRRNNNDFGKVEFKEVYLSLLFVDKSQALIKALGLSDTQVRLIKNRYSEELAQCDMYLKIFCTDNHPTWQTYFDCLSQVDGLKLDPEFHRAARTMNVALPSHWAPMSEKSLGCGSFESTDMTTPFLSLFWLLFMIFPVIL